VKVFAGYTSLDLRDEAQPTFHRERQGSYVLAFDVADRRPGSGGRGRARAVGHAQEEAPEGRRHQGGRAAARGRSESPLIKNTLLKDPTHTEAEALEQIYALLRPGEAPNLETRDRRSSGCSSTQAVRPGAGGRYKINQRLKVNVPKDHTVLHRGRLHRDHPLPDRAAGRARATPTTSTTSATAACARWAS